MMMHRRPNPSNCHIKSRESGKVPKTAINGHNHDRRVGCARQARTFPLAADPTYLHHWLRTGIDLTCSSYRRNSNGM